MLKIYRHVFFKFALQLSSLHFPISLEKTQEKMLDVK